MLVLASASPRRREILQNVGIPFAVQAADIVEVAKPDETPKAFAERLAQEKAKAVSQQRPDDWILSADTIVVVDNTILGKPRDPVDAVRMLCLLSGRQHQVITGVCLAGREISDVRSQFSVPGFVDVRSEITQVFVNDISENEIREYVETAEPMDKAGAYAIQGRASRWISRIEGDYFNVVGLPVSLVYRMLQHHKII
jgi:septum formation protein